jgi:hypothetical protein
MSHHYSGPDVGFPHGDARLDLTDVLAFPAPASAGKSSEATIDGDIGARSWPVEVQEWRQGACGRLDIPGCRKPVRRTRDRVW